jgi:guanylate kinase
MRECITSSMAKVVTQIQKNLSCHHLLEKMELLHHCYQRPSALGVQTCCNQAQRILISISWQGQKITVQ